MLRGNLIWSSLFRKLWPESARATWLMWSWEGDSWHSVCIQITVPTQTKLATKCWEIENVVYYHLQIKESARSWTGGGLDQHQRILRNSGYRLRILQEPLSGHSHNLRNSKEEMLASYHSQKIRGLDAGPSQQVLLGTSLLLPGPVFLSVNWGTGLHGLLGALFQL